MAEALLDKVLGKLGSEETPAYEVLEKYTKEKIWNTKNMSHSLHAQEKLQQNRKRKLILLQQTIM